MDVSLSYQSDFAGERVAVVTHCFLSQTPFEIPFPHHLVFRAWQKRCQIELAFWSFSVTHSLDTGLQWTNGWNLGWRRPRRPSSVIWPDSGRPWLVTRAFLVWIWSQRRLVSCRQSANATAWPDLACPQLQRACYTGAVEASSEIDFGRRHRLWQLGLRLNCHRTILTTLHFCC